MISPTRDNTTVILDGLPGERREFTIKANGKAFRTLIDNLYSDKIKSLVREVMSNGLDSHAEAGIGDRPISVTAPTALDPVFRVRDYGVSMDHDTVMNLYTTIFESSKEDTNDQVGRFGLGSKSPFAYTDSFQVQAILDGVKRTYVAHIADDGVPQISNIHTEATEEEQGVEVTLAVQPQDVFDFHKAIGIMLASCPTMPEVDGMQFDMPEVIASGEGWTIYERSGPFRLDSTMVRQGWVMYPIKSDLWVSRLVQPGAATIVVDIPVGTADVTASREALSLTPETREQVKKYLSEAEEGIQEYLEGRMAAVSNTLERFRLREELGEWTNNCPGPYQLSLMPKREDAQGKPLKDTKESYAKLVEKYAIVKMTTKTKREHFYQTRDPQSLRVLVDNGQPILRKQLRIAAWFDSRHRNVNGVYGSTKVICRADQVGRVMRLFGLVPTQFTSLHNLPDVEVNRNRVYGPSTAGQNRGQYGAAPKTNVFPKDKYWVPKEGATSVADHPILSELGDLDYRFRSLRTAEKVQRWLRYDAAWLGVESDDVLFLTEKQAAKMKAPEDRILWAHIKPLALAYAIRHKVAAASAGMDFYNERCSYSYKMQNLLPSSPLRETVIQHVMGVMQHYRTQTVNNHGAIVNLIQSTPEYKAEYRLTKDDMRSKFDSEMDKAKELLTALPDFQAVVDLYESTKP